MFSQHLGIDVERFIVPRDNGWDAVKKIVENLRSAEYDDYLETVDEIMRKNTR